MSPKLNPMSEVVLGNPLYPKALHPQASALQASVPSLQWSDGSGRGRLVQIHLSSASGIQVEVYLGTTSGGSC